MKIAKAQRHLQNAGVSYFDNNILGTPDRRTHKAVAALREANVSYIHPMHAAAYPETMLTKKKGAYINVDNLNFSEQQSHAYMAYVKSPYVQSVVNAMRNFTVSSGLSLQSNPAESVNDDFSIEATKAWNTWTSHTDADYVGMQTYNQLEAQRALHFFIFGEYFYLRRIENGKLTIQIIDPRSVSSPSHPDSKDIRNGIELDANGRPTALYILTQSNPITPIKHVRVPYMNGTLKQVAHSKFLHVNMNNTQRGVSPFLRMLPELEKITEADRYELLTAKINASMALMVKDSQSMLSQNKTIANDLQKAQTKKQHEFAEMDGGIMIDHLPKGVEIESFESGRPSVNLREFIENKYRHLTPAICGIANELIDQKFTNSFSAARAAVDLSYNVFHLYIKNNFGVDNQIDYEIFTSLLVKSGALQTQNFDVKTHCIAKWNGIQKPQFNSLQEAKASEIRILAGVSTREYESQMHNGNSAKENAEQLRKEEKDLNFQADPEVVEVIE